MSRSAILALIFVISIVAARNLRVSSAAEGKSDGEKDSPSPSPSLSVKMDQNTTKLPNPDPKPSKSGRSPKDELSPQGPPESSQEGGECNGLSSTKCAEGKLVACLQDPESGSRELFLLVKNEGVDNLTVNIKAPASSKINIKELQLADHQRKKINITVNPGDSLKIVLNAGNGDCVLQMAVPAPPVDFLSRLPSYATRMTPIYGAYFLFLTLLIVGGTWACCKFGKRGRRGDGGVQYQELEMGLPQSTSAANADTADGWDEGWDDDWEEKATSRTSEIRSVGNVSANGLTSRSPPKREGWDDDWDD